MIDPHGLDSAHFSRSVRFVKFLREAVAIKTKQVLEVQKYPGLIWFSELPSDLQEVRSPLTTPNWPASDPHWLKIARVQEPARPLPPDECKPWLESVDLDSPETPPALNPECEQLNESGELIKVAPAPEAQRTWERYLADDWKRWAEKAAIARAVKPVYQKLFSMQQQLQGVADSFDIFVGVGLFHSRTNVEQPFRRHLLAFPAELSLDDRTGALTVGPAPDFVRARIETDFLPMADRARLQSQVDSLQEDLMNLGAGVGDEVSIGKLLTRLITPINAVTQYV